MHFRALKDLDSSEGTVQLVENVDSGHAHLAGTDLVLVPQPSDDPTDPLRWSAWKKWGAFLTIGVFNFWFAVFSGALGPAFYILSQEFDKSISRTAELLTYVVLLLGLGNLVWVPMAVYFGRRPVFLLCTAVTFGCAIWSAVAKSFESLLAARVIAAFFGAVTEANSAIIVSDIFFLHERGTKMGIYIILLASGSSVGPAYSGFIVQATGWRWINWITVIAFGITFVCVIFLVPETRFDRVYSGDLSTPLPTVITPSATEKEPKPHSVVLPAAHVECSPDINSIESAAGPASKHYTEAPYIQGLSPWSGIAKDVSLLDLFIRPYTMIVYPAVFWALLGYCMALAAVIIASSLNAFVFQAPPYNFSPAVNGLINISSLIGNLFGAFCGGYLTDVFARWHARRHGGVFVPESRLPTMIIPAILVPTGLLMSGFCAQKDLHWAVGYVGYGFISVGLTSVSTICMTYVVDCYYPVAPEALLIINAFKNIAAFGVIFAAVPWVTRSGFQNVFGALTGIYLAVLAPSIVFYIWGAKIRHYTSTRWKLIHWPIAMPSH